MNIFNYFEHTFVHSCDNNSVKIANEIFCTKVGNLGFLGEFREWCEYIIQKTIYILIISWLSVYLYVIYERIMACWMLILIKIWWKAAIFVDFGPIAHIYIDHIWYIIYMIIY